MTTREETFSCWVPATIVKGGAQAGDSRRIIQGIASTNHRDLQGEIVDPTGIDTQYFLQSGFFNNDHKPGTENKVGEPLECKVTKDGLWVKGFVYEGKKAADDIWEHMTALTKSGSRRKMGFSIEGRVVRRNNSVIEKCWIQDIAITPAPVNPKTWATIVKSLSASSVQVPESLEEEEAEALSLTEAKELVKSVQPDLSDEQVDLFVALLSE